LSNSLYDVGDVTSRDRGNARSDTGNCLTMIADCPSQVEQIHDRAPDEYEQSVIEAA